MLLVYINTCTVSLFDAGTYKGDIVASVSNHSAMKACKEVEVKLHPLTTALDEDGGQLYTSKATDQ
jgi:hypothetical protein